MTAENIADTRKTITAYPGFNEAAADDRGKHAAEDRRRARWQKASMRPRPMTAENVRRLGRPSAWERRFNEAAADDRGKHIRATRAGTAAGGGFNEAAADDRGKRKFAAADKRKPPPLQ